MPRADTLTNQAANLKEALKAWFLPKEFHATGTFTPTYEGSVTPGTTTYSTQTGNHIRIGRLVIANGNMTWTNATGTGAVRLGGLPFTPTSAGQWAFAVWTNNVTFANGSIQGILQGSVGMGQLFSPLTNAAGTELGIEVAGTIRYTMVYHID